jgi:transcription initiation factor TFIIIB Brf1 subunit/transcription initiation factor TFIIB
MHSIAKESINSLNKKNRRIKEDISTLCLRMRLTEKIHYRIEYIYEKAKEKKLIQGRDPYSIVVAATYVAYKESGIV